MPRAEPMTYEAAHAAPECDSTYPRDTWERAQRELAQLDPVFRRLAAQYGVTLHLNLGGRYPEPARVLRRDHDLESIRVRLAPYPDWGTASNIVGYRLLGVETLRQPWDPIRRWLQGANGSWNPIGVFGADHVAAAAPAIVAALERVAEEAFGPHPPAV
jgi:hypothetical protein